MDPKLAEIYGTNQPDEADVEKLAAAELAEELTEEGEMDLDSLSEEEAEQLAQQVLSGGEETEEAAVEEPEADEESQEKVAEADYLGRVMAHAFVQENREIEKDAGVKDLAAKAAKHGKAAFGKVKEVAKKGAEKAKRSRLAELAKGGRLSHDAPKDHKLFRPGNKASAHFKGKHKGEAWKATGARAGALAAVGGGAAAMHKKSSALDTLVEKRALEILKANGIEAEIEPAQPEQTEKTSAAGDKYDQLAAVVEQRAMEFLQANGYQFEQPEEQETE